MSAGAEYSVSTGDRMESENASSLLLLSSIAKETSSKKKRKRKEPVSASPAKKVRIGGDASHSIESNSSSSSGSTGIASATAVEAAKAPSFSLSSASASSSPFVSVSASTSVVKQDSKKENGETETDEKQRKLKEKKATHNATEKRRQARISMQFVELKNLVESASGQTIRRGRGQILAATLLFMGAILQENLTLRNSLNQVIAQQQMNAHIIGNVGVNPHVVTPPITAHGMLQYHQQAAGWPNGMRASGVTGQYQPPSTQGTKPR